MLDADLPWQVVIIECLTIITNILLVEGAAPVETCVRATLLEPPVESQVSGLHLLTISYSLYVHLGIRESLCIL